MRQKYEIKEKVTCDICKKDMAKQRKEEYYLAGDHHHNYIRFRIHHDGGDLCNVCEAKTLFFV